MLGKLSGVLYHKWFGRGNLKRQILAPFIAIITIMTLTSMGLSVYFITDVMSRYLESILTHHQLLFGNKIREYQNRAAFYARFLSHTSNSTEWSQPLKQIPQQLSYWDNISIQWHPSTSPSQKWFNSSFELQYIEKYDQSKQSPFAIFRLTPSFLHQFDSQNQCTTLLMTKDSHGKWKWLLSRRDPLFTSEFQSVLIQTLTVHPHTESPTFSFLVGTTWYKAVFSPLQGNPSVTVVSLIPITGIRHTTGKIIIASIFLLVLINALILMLYSAFIQYITQSIDELSKAAKSIAKGDWKTHLTIQTKDEIGELASTFNHMVDSLNTYSTRLILEKNRSEAIIAFIPEGIIVTDMENRLLLANQKAEDLFHFSSHQLQGKILLEYITNEALSTTLAQSLESQQKEMTREVHIPDPAGKNRVYVLTSGLARSTTHEPIGVITILRDITHEKNLEELREGFLRTVTHELRTPLTSIIGFIELVLKNADNEAFSKKEFLKIALSESKTLKELIDDLLDLSRFRAGNVPMVYTDILVAELFQQLSLTFMPLAAAKKVFLKVDPVPPSLSISADLPKLRRILVNLISNAIKFTHEGTITLGCREEESTLVFYVSDTGIGLLEHEMDVIFEKFRQIDYSSTRQYEGIGLGLSIVKQLVEMHQGKVWVKSQYGQGSTFSFSIPKKQV